MGLSLLRYLDASVVIDGTDPNSPRFAAISAAIQSLAPSERCVGELVRLECLVQPTRTGDISRVSLLETYFAGLVTLPLPRAVFDLAIRLRADRQGLKTPDALHLATALHSGCGEFWTGDLDLAKVPVSLTFRSF